MAIRFQYNKISLQSLNKQLKIRIQALPILKNKESALRVEVKKAKEQADNINLNLQTIIDHFSEGIRLWAEFDSEIVRVKEINVEYVKIAGIKIPEFKDISFNIKYFSLFESPGWFPEGLRYLRRWSLFRQKGILR